MNAKLSNKHTLGQIKIMAKLSNRLVYGAQSCWWKIGSPCYQTPVDSGIKLPCGPRGELLLETDNPMAFIAVAEKNPSHYGKHGIEAFVAAYHENVIDENGLPTSLKNWDDYNQLLDEESNNGQK